MDWQNVRFDWNRARAFLVTAEEGSLSAAARALGMAQPTLGRQVEALQQELGVALFERTGRGLELTPSGLDLLEHVRTMREAAGRLQGVDGRPTDTDYFELTTWIGSTHPDRVGLPFAYAQAVDIDILGAF